MQVSGEQLARKMGRAKGGTMLGVFKKTKEARRLQWSNWEEEVCRRCSWLGGRDGGWGGRIMYGTAELCKDCLFLSKMRSHLKPAKWGDVIYVLKPSFWSFHRHYYSRNSYSSFPIWRNMKLRLSVSYLGSD